MMVVATNVTLRYFCIKFKLQWKFGKQILYPQVTTFVNNANHNILTLPHFCSMLLFYNPSAKYLYETSG